MKADTYNTKLSGLDLKLEGTGMKAFYGDPSTGDIGIVGRVAESIVGKGSVGTTGINSILGTKEVTKFYYFFFNFLIFGYFFRLWISR